MKTPPSKKNLANIEANRSQDWLRKKLSQQKKIPQVRPVQFHGTQHRG